MATATTTTSEKELHLQVRDALNEELQDYNFFLWLTVTPGTGTEQVVEELTVPVAEIDAWLEQLDPDHLPTKFPSKVFEVDGVGIEITALAKRTEARSERSKQVVANPLPALYVL